MESAPTIQTQQSALPESAPAPQKRGAETSLRTCLATGEELSKDFLIRFVVGPDNSIVPDLSANLPGRGLWVKAEREAIETAARKNLFSKAAKTSVTVDKSLTDHVEALLRKRCLDFMGLAKRAGATVLGQPQVEAALRSQQLGLLLVAQDAVQSLENRGVAVNRLFTRTEMGAAFGYEQNVYVGLLRHTLTDKLKIEIARLEKIALQHNMTDGNG